MNAFVSAIKLKGISTISRLESVFLKGPMRAAITLTVVRLGTSGTLMSAVVCPCLLARKAIALIPHVKVRASTYALASKTRSAITLTVVRLGMGGTTRSVFVSPYLLAS